MAAITKSHKNGAHGPIAKLEKIQQKPNPLKFG